MSITEVDTNLFLFHYIHEMDMETVIEGGLWTFDQHMLVCCPLEANKNHLQVPLFHAQI